MNKTDSNQIIGWQPIETAPNNERVLLRYYKGSQTGRTRITKTYIVTEAVYFNRNGIWNDALGRLICMDSAKSKKNIPTHWMPMPPDPE